MRRRREVEGVEALEVVEVQPQPAQQEKAAAIIGASPTRVASRPKRIAPKEIAHYMTGRLSDRARLRTQGASLDWAQA